jgi:large subunit ribosomal protein L23
MNVERLYKVILGPHVSEKTSLLGELAKKQIAFKVAVDATKIEVSQAVEKIFNVKVSDVTVCNMKAKRKFFGRVPGKRNAWKKAYVSLQEGFDIDFAGSAE